MIFNKKEKNRQPKAKLEVRQFFPIYVRKSKPRAPLELFNISVFQKKSLHKEFVQIQNSQQQILEKELKQKLEKIKNLNQSNDLKQKEINHYQNYIKKQQEEIDKQKEVIKDLNFQFTQFRHLYNQASDTIQDLKNQNKQVIQKHNEINQKFGRLLDIVQESKDEELMKQMWEILESPKEPFPKEAIDIDYSD